MYPLTTRMKARLFTGRFGLLETAVPSGGRRRRGFVFSVVSSLLRGPSGPCRGQGGRRTAGGRKCLWAAASASYPASVSWCGPRQLRCWDSFYSNPLVLRAHNSSHPTWVSISLFQAPSPAGLLLWCPLKQGHKTTQVLSLSSGLPIWEALPRRPSSLLQWRQTALKGALAWLLPQTLRPFWWKHPWPGHSDPWLSGKLQRCEEMKSAWARGAWGILPKPLRLFCSHCI